MSQLHKNVLRFTTLILIAALLTRPALAQTSSPDELAREFYAWVLSEPGIGLGLPSAKERQRFAAFLSPALLQLVDNATVMEKQCIESAVPGDKPHVIESHLLVGNDAGASEVVVGSARHEGKIVFVESRLFSVDARFPMAHAHRTVTWTDTLVLTSAGNHWVIDNIQFESGQSLANFLREYLKNAAKWCAIKSAQPQAK